MTQTGREYSQALFSLAIEENMKTEISDSLTFMKEVFCENPDFARLLSSPAVSLNERLSIIDTAFSNQNEYAVSLLKLLSEKRLVDIFDECTDGYNEMVRESGSISSATVTSAVELTPAQREALLKKLENITGHTVIMEEKTDPSLIGGIIIETDGKVIDASLRQSLSDIKDVIRR